MYKINNRFSRYRGVARERKRNGIERLRILGVLCASLRRVVSRFMLYVPPLGLSMRARSREREREREIRLLNMTIMTLDVVRFFFFSETGFSEMALKIEKDYADVATERNLFVPYIIRCYV